MSQSEQPRKPVTQTTLKARASIAADLYREGRIRRPECFRAEMDAALGETQSLPLKLKRKRKRSL